MKTEAQKFFEQQQNTSIDDLSFEQVDELEPPYYVEVPEAMTMPYVKPDVEKPLHYHFFGEDTMPMIEKILGTEGYLGFLKGNALKYRLRVGKKEGNSIEKDIAKAMYYEKLYNDFVKENTPHG